MKLSKTRILRGVSIVSALVLGTGLGIGNGIAFANGNNLDTILCPPPVNSERLEQSRQQGFEMAKELVEEGSVLLKNNNNTLPLSKDVKKINVFGWASVDWAYGAQSSSCSGRIIAEDGKAESLYDFCRALEEYGVEYNTELQEMYKRYMKPNVYATKDPGSIDNNKVVTLTEPDINNKSFYTDELLENASNYSDTAVVIITRNAGEDIQADRAMNKQGAGASKENKIYLDLSIEEEHLLTYVGSNFKDVVVLINSPVAMDLKFLNEIPGLGAALQVGFTGTRGALVIPELLYGDKTPSGHLVDTVPYDRNNSFAMRTKNGYQWKSGGNGKNCFEYIENIYVGYKWYETADAENYWADYSRTVLDENDSEVEVSGFDAVVQYPFGYGLSYTNFEWEVRDTSIYDKGEKVSKITGTSELHYTVRVKNVGEFEGKDVVECYMSAPYTKGGIEKSFVNLVGYEKTVTLKPGEFEDLELVIDIEDCLSYDCYDKNNDHHAGYELEAGDYQFKLMRNSHEIKKVDFYLGEKNVDGIITEHVDKTIHVDNDKHTGAPVYNLFTGEDAVDGFPIDAIYDDYSPEYLTRENFTDIQTFEGLERRDAPQQLNDTFKFTQSKGDNWDKAEYDIFGNDTHQEAVTWNQNNGLKIAENGSVNELGLKLAEDYNDPQWDEVLDQISYQEAVETIQMSYGTPAIDSVGKPKLSELDGPAQMKCYYQAAPRGTGYPDAVVVAQTWNKELGEDFGFSYAADMQALNIYGLWGWGTNLHRTPVGGRNWEYFSEDPFMSGSTLTAAVKGLNKGGRFCYIKHFALNESEHSKVEGFTFTTEQALREAYFKPFQMAIQRGGALGIMTSFNRIGAVYSGGSEASLTGVVRNEWGFKGNIITDWANDNGYMSIDHQLRAGGDLGMNVHLNSGGLKFNYNEKGSNRLQYQMREAVHHVLYTYVRSAYNNKVYNENPDTKVKVVQTSTVESWKWWRVLLIDADILIGGAALLFVALTFIPKKKEA